MKIDLSLDTVTFMLKNNETKYIFCSFYKDILADRVFKRVLSFIQYSINELRIKSIELLSSLVAINFKQNLLLNKISLNDATELTLNLFNIFISNLDANRQIAMDKLFNLLLNLAKQPFVDVRLAAQTCFNSFTQSKWGLSCLFNTNDSGHSFIVYLLDRSTELEKEGRLSKYDLVKSVANSEFISEFINLNQLALLNKYVREGAFYRESEMAVEFQSA